MKSFMRLLIVVLVLSLSITLLTGVTLLAGDDYLSFSGRHDPIWKLEASNLLLIGGYGDNFNYDGSRVIPLKGRAMVNLNADKNTGSMEVTFRGMINPEKGKVYSGDIRIVYSKFMDGPPYWEGGVADYVYLHGDTKQEAPVMPKIRTYLATWGPADVYVNGELVYKGLAGHMMYTERSRDTETFAIYNRDRSGFYNPKNSSNSSIANPNEKEIHFVAHTNDPDRGNFPPHTVWIHLNFTDVKEIR